ncbi:hypothetical protein ACIRIU_24340 [Streptomyces sp. NPDC102351]|uniref:hypothetical protein n=1 Tax=Streptomyces sp. NPDC102351 TaxID=3366158 RepID=UPI0037F2E5C9
MFDPTKRPWIQPDNITADQLAEVVRGRDCAVDNVGGVFAGSADCDGSCAPGRRSPRRWAAASPPPTWCAASRRRSPRCSPPSACSASAPAAAPPRRTRSTWCRPAGPPRRSPAAR